MAGTFRNSQKQFQVCCDKKGKEFGGKIGYNRPEEQGVASGIVLKYILYSKMR